MQAPPSRLRAAMPEIVRRSRRVGFTAVIAAVAVLAVACGSGTVTTEVAADPSPAQEPEPAAGGESEDSPTSTESRTETETEADGGETTSEPAVNLFPDVEVTNIVDSSSLNLATELGGGDLPVLLWFWAPH